MTLRSDFIPIFDEEPTQAASAALPWRVLIVDDDPEVHRATKLACLGLRLLDRPIEWLEAYSGADATRVATEQRGLAVAIVDVVMESPTAGLDLVAWLRSHYDPNLRIILRTGQPGYAPELETVLQHDINAYRTKSELTSSQLIAVLATALRNYQEMQRVELASRAANLAVVAADAALASAGAFDRADHAEQLLRHCADLIGAAPVCDGFVAVQAGAGLPMFVLYGQGSYAPHSGQPVAELGASACGHITRIVEEQHSHVADDHVGFGFFPGAGFLVIAYVASLNTRTALNYVDLFARHISMCWESRRLNHALSRVAYMHAGTRLPNHAGILRALASRESAHGLLLIAIDDHDSISELLGPERIELLHETVATALRGSFPGRVIGCVGSGVFCVITEITDRGLEHVNAQFQQSLDLGGLSTRITLSAGATDADSTLAPERIYHQAVLALAAARPRGHAQLVRYDYAMSSRALVRRRIFERLSTALTQRQLRVVYQPKIDLASGVCVGVEALARWPEGEVPVDPESFISVAEESGLIAQLGQQVMDIAMRDWSLIEQANGRPTGMAVNVSVAQIFMADVVAEIAQGLELHRMPADRLCVEVTESIAADFAGTKDFVTGLHGLGVKIAIDDFGKGFSSLSYLGDLNVDAFKIDRSFISALDEGGAKSRVSQLVVNLCHVLHLEPPVAEGVETVLQRDRLLSMGIQVGQGYYWARPKPLPDLLVWLRELRLAKPAAEASGFDA